MKQLIFFLFALVIGNSTFAKDNPPSFEVIQEWWNNKSIEKMFVNSNQKLLPIFLKNHEVAYLLDVGFFERGRNFTDQTVMVRPKLHEVKEVGHPVRRDSVVHDLDHDGISEVETVSLGSGQGTTIGGRSIVQFRGWRPIVLHQATFKDNEGVWGDRVSSFYARSIKWEFFDLDGDGIDDLIETITIKKGRNNKSPITTTKTYKYLFKNSKFIQLDDDIKEDKSEKKNG